MGKGFFSEEEAIAHWNRRVNDNASDEVLWYFANEAGKVVAQTFAGTNEDNIAIDRLMLQVSKGKYTLGYFKKDGTQKIFTGAKQIV